MRARLGLVCFGALALLLAGCTAVPSHSAPQAITPIAQNPTVGPSSNPPPPGASPREIVQDFLNVSAVEAGAQGSARDYLTRAVRGSWQDSSVTIVDATSVSNYSPKHPTITVRGREIGSVDEQGIYNPTNDGTGSGSKISPYVYGITQVDGQYRIDKLPGSAPGLLLTLDQFTHTYESHALEFYDLAEHYLIPDLRYSPLHGAPLAEWLISQLAARPRPELQKAVSPGGLPTPANGAPPTVQLGDVTKGAVTKVAVPGAAQLDTAGRYRLAAQLSRTLIDVIRNGLLSITDGGKAIEIPRVNSDQFVATQFENVTGPAQPPPELFYLRDGRVVNAKGQSLTGTGVDGTPNLTAVALTNSPLDANSLFVAGTHALSATSRQLYVGTQQLGLRPTNVRGLLSRPAWAPGRAEVWIGDGPTLYRLTVRGATRTERFRVSLPLPSAAHDAPIEAVRISPDGSRIALVLGARGAGQIYVGAIVRSGGQVGVGDLLTPISPVNVAVTDVAWNGLLKLFAIGFLTSDGAARVCETNVDGSGWTMSAVPGLPAGPDALTVTANALAWVEVNDTVWTQGGNTTWVSPSGTGTGQVPGRNPVYLE